jgi:hypothetical protein
LLSPAERLAVLGDLTEVRVRDSEALRHVAGLVVRRQLQHACSIPGLIGMVLALPSGIVLGERSSHWATGTGVYLWTYLHAGGFEPLARTIWGTGDATATAVIVWVLLNAGTLLLWSCTAGWALGVLARRGIWIPVIAFYAIVLVNSPVRRGIDVIPGHPAFIPLGFVATAAALYGALLVIAPALWGVGRSMADRRRASPAALLLAAGAVLVTCRAIGL